MRAHWLVGLGISGLVAANCAQGSSFDGIVAGGVGAGDGTVTSTGSSQSGAGGSSQTQAAGSTSGAGSSGGGSAGTTTTTAGAGGASGSTTTTGSAGGSTSTTSTSGGTTSSTTSGGTTTSSSSSTSSSTTSSGGALATQNEACTSTSDCAAGLTCAPAFDNGGQQCENTCTTSSECASPGGVCENLTTGKTGTVCTTACNPMTDANCLPTEACRMFAGKGTTVDTYCGGVGTKGQGGACTVNSDCKAGFECITDFGSGDCEEICDVNNDTCPGVYSCTDLGVTLGSTEIGTCE